MIGHQAVCPDLDLVGGAPLPHELQVDPLIFIAKERLLPAVSPLGDEVRQARSITRASRAMTEDHQAHDLASIIVYGVPGTP